MAKDEPGTSRVGAMNRLEEATLRAAAGETLHSSFKMSLRPLCPCLETGGERVDVGLAIAE